MCTCDDNRGENKLSKIKRGRADKIVVFQEWYTYHLK